MRRQPPQFLRLIVFLLIFASGLVVGWSGVLPNPISGQPAGVPHDFRPFWEAWRLVEDRYVDREAVSADRLKDGAISGMLNALGDTDHTTYLTADEASMMAERLSGHMEGIGVRFTMRQGRPVIVSVLPDSPAMKSGVKAGDVLEQADGKDLKDKSREQIVQMVTGAAGSTLQLTVGREGEAEPVTLSITRARIDLPYVEWHMLQGRPVAHVAIESFGENADKQLRQAIEGARQQGARGLLVDVRANGGGLKDQAVAVTSEFLKEGNVFMEKDAKGHETPVPVKPGGTATDIPIVVLIDEGTASSAEIFAGAIQDYQRGKLVGTRTVGTGTVLQPYELSDHSAVLLAVQQWLTPKGQTIWHKGIAPDVPVPLPAGTPILSPDESGRMSASELGKTSDKQLLKALEVLEAQLK
jgi:carboxyl-terminal processing protease